jgi:hypothetical protein
MTKHSIALGDGLMTLTAEWVRGNMLVTLNDAIDRKYTISRVLTHTYNDVGIGVFDDEVEIIPANGVTFKRTQVLSTITSPRSYLIQVMCTVNAARRFYGLPPIVWEHVEDKRKVYLGGLEVTTDKSGYLYADKQIASHIVRPGGMHWSDISDSCKAEWGTTDFIIEALELANVMRVKAGLRELVWEVV